MSELMLIRVAATRRAGDIGRDHEGEMEDGRNFL
jgi:hypothetical protein